MAARIEDRNKSVNIDILISELEKSDITILSEGNSYPVTVTDGTQKFSIKENGTIKNVDSVPVAQIAEKKEKYYGKEVTNYTAGGHTYRVFYVDEAGDYGDENTIYLKAEPSGNGIYLSSYISYIPKTTDVLELMNPNWWSNRGTESASWNPNEHCAAYLCDPTTSESSSNQAWASYFDSELANYVIGSPSVEMYVKSYNQVTHTVGDYTLGASYSGTNAPGYIYTLNGAQSTISHSDYSTGTTTLDNVGYNGMYCKNYVWLASPSSEDIESVCRCCGGRYVMLDTMVPGLRCSVNPIVALKEGFVPDIEI